MIYFIITLGFLVFMHELGHFLLARANGIDVEEFSVGFGPKLFAKKVGRTIYKICILPFGGYVKMKGENPEELKDGEPLEPDSFAAKSVPRRLSVVLAGPITNILLCFLVLPLAFMIGVHVPDLKDVPAAVGKVIPGSPADLAGIVEGDTIVSLQGQPVKSWNSFVEDVQKQGWLPLAVGITHDGHRSTKIILTQFDSGTRRHLIGVQRTDPVTTLERYGVVESVKMGVQEAWGMVDMTFAVLGKLFSGEIGIKALSGPLGIAKASATVAKKGFGDLLHFMAFLSIQLGILNLLPIPVLDGGHVLFMAIETIRRKPLSIKFRAMAQIVGLVMLLSLMLIVTVNDANTLFGLRRLFAKWF